MISIAESFQAVLSFADGLATRLPRTKAGVEALRITWESGDIQKVYPDGRRHAAVDWDEIGRAVELHQHHKSERGQ